MEQIGQHNLSRNYKTFLKIYVYVRIIHEKFVSKSNLLCDLDLKTRKNSNDIITSYYKKCKKVRDSLQFFPEMKFVL